jgi:hypothetical protein
MAQRVVSVSLRARGITSVNTSKSFNLYTQSALLLTACYDAPASFILTLSLLSWSSWLSIFITIIVAGVDLSYNSWISGQFNSKITKLYDPKCLFAPNLTQTSGSICSNDATIDGSTSIFIHLLFIGALLFPLGVLLTLVLRRRDMALSHLASLKSNIVALCLSSSDSPALDLVRVRTFTLLEDLHTYLSHRRSYAVHFLLPYLSSSTSPNPTSDTLISMTREIGLLIRKVQLGLRDLHLSVQSLKSSAAQPEGCSEAHYHFLQGLTTKIHQSIEEISAIKEYRSPAPLRALVHWLVVIMYPVFMGFAYQNAYIVTSLNVMLGFLFVFIQISALVIHDTTRGMEDVFNESSLDTISLFEVMDSLSRMTDTSLQDNGDEDDEDDEEELDPKDQKIKVGKPRLSKDSKSKVQGSKSIQVSEEGDPEEGRGGGNSQVRVGVVELEVGENEQAARQALRTKGKGAQLKVTQFKSGQHPPLPMPPLPTATGIGADFASGTL